MRREWSRKDIERLSAMTLEGVRVDDIARDFKACRKTILDMQRELGLRGAKREPWTDEEKAIVRELYPNVKTSTIAERIGKSESGVYQYANKVGLAKSAEYLASPEACRLRRGDNVGAEHRFKPGIVPHNKGVKRPGWAAGRMRETQFRKGSKPQTWRPIGTERLTKEGYLQRKVADTGNTVADYVEVHRIIWEEANGPIPPGHVVVFKDRDRTHIAIDNLELITRAELARRNTIHNLPQDLKEVIRLNANIKRRIRRMQREKQDDGSAQPSLRDSRGSEGSGEAYGD